MMKIASLEALNVDVGGFDVINDTDITTRDTPRFHADVSNLLFRRRPWGRMERRGFREPEGAPSEGAPS